MRLPPKWRYLSSTAVLLILLVTLLAACGSNATPTVGPGANGTPAATVSTPKPTATTLALQVGNSSAKVNLTYMTWGGDNDKSRRFKEVQACDGYLLYPSSLLHFEV